jgi:hypothetical protein
VAVILTGSEYIDLDSHGAALDVRSRPLTWYAEFTSSTTDQIMFLLAHGRNSGAGTQEYAQLWVSASQIRTRWNGSAQGQVEILGANTNDGSFHRFANVVRSSVNTMAQFLDGSASTSDSNIGSGLTTADINDTTVIGRDSGADQFYFIGQISNVAVWDAELTTQQLEDLTSGTIDPSDLPTGLLGYWPLDYDARDVSGNELHGTPVGSPDFTEEPPGDEVDVVATATVSVAASQIIPVSARVGKDIVSDPPFVTSVDASGRFLLDQYGAPILIRGESPWSMFTDLSPVQADTYLTNRAGYGCNTALVSMIGSVANGGPSDDGATFDDILPFTGGDVTVFNETYWSRMDTFIATARDLGITLLIYPMDGWNTRFESVVFNPGNVSNADCQAYGQALAERYAGEPNILWAFGGDYAEDNTVNERFGACLDGIRAAGDQRLATVQLNFRKSLSSDSSFWSSRVGWNFVYTYYVTYKAMFDGYGHTWSPSPLTRPALFSEGAYENSGSPHFGTDEALRRQICWALTSGSPGDFTGQEGVWNFQSNWESLLDSTAAGQIQSIRDTFEALAWTTLVPDTGSDLVTAGRGTEITTDSPEVFPVENDYVTAARAADGSLAVIYMPDASVQITIDEGQMSGGYTATWVDPASGASISETPSATYSRGNNSAGDSDWLLVLEG